MTEVFLAASLSSPLSSLLGSAQRLQAAAAYSDRLAEVLDRSPQPVTKGTAPELAGGIALRGVSFGYLGRKGFTVRDINADFPQGSFTAVVGPSGCGKSTLISLILCLLTPHSGQVMFDGRALSPADFAFARQRIGCVLQDDTLLQGTVRENISAWRPGIALGDVVRAAKLAGAHDEIAAMDAGYDTFVSEDGRNLSGGQKQRIALARALVCRPVILILDEALSNLDPASAHGIARVLRGLRCTRILVSHRVALAAQADTVLAMEGGAIVESGAHLSLLERRGPYYAMLRAELGDSSYRTADLADALGRRNGVLPNLAMASEE